MHPSVMAALAVQLQDQLLRDAQAQRLRTSRAAQARAAGHRRRPVTQLQRWARNLSRMFRPAPEPCCA